MCFLLGTVFCLQGHLQYFGKFKDPFTTVSHCLALCLSLWAAIKAAPKSVRTMDLPFPIFFCSFLLNTVFFTQDKPENASFPQPSSVHSKLDKLYNPLASLAEGSSWDCAFPSLPESLYWKIRLQLNHNSPLSSTLCAAPVESSSSSPSRTPCFLHLKNCHALNSLDECLKGA